MDLDALIFAGFVLYLFFSIFGPSKKKGKAKKARQKRVKRAKQQLPQSNQNPQRPKSLEAVLQEMYRQQTGEAMPSQKQIVVEQEPEVFSYDTEYESYDDQYEGKAYDERRKKEIEHILDTRHKGEHVSNTLHDKIEANKKKAKIAAAKKKKKKLIGQDFKYNAKDAIIYDVIMNRKYK